MSNFCEECKAEKSKKQTTPCLISFTHEAEMARAERNIKRLWVALIVSITALLLSNIIYFLA